jgi:hypothetical protein
MWNWLNCYLSGRHDYGVSCSSGSIYLRCIHCGKRSEGWTVHSEQGQHHQHAPGTTPVTNTLPFTPRNTGDQQPAA